MKDFDEYYVYVFNNENKGLCSIMNEELLFLILYYVILLLGYFF